jgi:hypothetical protein
MDPGAMIYIPSFIKIGSGIQKLLGGFTYSQQGDGISLLLFFRNKEGRPKMLRNYSTSFQDGTKQAGLAVTL